MAIIYNNFLHDNQENINFETFIEFQREKYNCIDISSTRIKDKYKRCYDIFPDIYKIDKNKIINILTKCKISYCKIYLLHILEIKNPWQII